MPYIERLFHAWKSVLSKRPSSDRIRLLPSVASGVIGVFLILAIGSDLLVRERLTRAAREDVPTLRESRALRDVLAATGDALQGTDLAGSVSRLARADIMAERFHALASAARLHEGQGPEMRALDERFSSYYVQARRAAEHLPSGDDAQTSSTELALVGDRAVRGMLDAHIASKEGAITDEMAAAQTLQMASWVVMTLVAAGAIVLLFALGDALTSTTNDPMWRAAAAVQSLAEGEVDLDLPATDDANVRALHQALQRIAATQRDNAVAAEALADGRYLRVTGPTRHDRIGGALARIAAYEAELTTVARRIADGDLTATIEPRSAHDMLGLAHEAMVAALVRLLREIDSATQAVADTAERMHGAAGALANGATEGAAEARRTSDSLARVTLAVQGTASRAENTDGRAMESAATIQEGTAVLHESLGALQAVLREASVVESLAGDAELLALNAAIEAARAGEEGAGFTVVAQEVRLLAQQASDAARELNLLSAAGAASATQSTELLGRLVSSMDGSAAVVRELTVSTRQHARELTALRGAMEVMHESTRRTASGAEHLAASADSLSVHALRLGALLRSCRRNDTEKPALAIASA